MIEITTTLPIEVTQELLVDMRLRGLEKEANELLEVWREKGKQEKAQMIKEINHYDNKIRYFIEKRKNSKNKKR